MATRIEHGTADRIPRYARKLAPINTEARRVWMNYQLEKQQLDALKARGLPFMAWDGEGVVHESSTDNAMSYVLFGCNGGTDESIQFIKGSDLRTRELLDFIWDRGQDYGDYIHVSFGFSFDVDQILKDCTQKELTELHDTNEVVTHGYRITYIPRKFFAIRKGRKRGITIYDTISFFYGNLIAVARQYVPDDPRIGEVAKGKSGRSSFEYSELDSIIFPYWKLEGELMVSIANALRYALTSAGIKLTSWHGPGAIAEALLKREKISAHIEISRVESPAEVTEATAYSFFGGRFECFKIGHIPGPIYSYDIRSAYPAALASMPGLSGGYWRHLSALSEPWDWGLYRAKLLWTDSQSPETFTVGFGPLPNRYKDGSVSFGVTTEGWYYGHELKAAILTGWNIQISEGWEYVESTDYPFIFLKELYLQRADWKRAGNPAQLAAKLGLNSIYGKLAQLTGWNEIENLPPKFHQQWYAGHTTSWCRARIHMAMSQAPMHIIACETDGIYSAKPLKLDIGPGLGQWEEEVYDEMVYVQSGMYWAKKDGVWTKAKTRGMSANDVSVDMALDYLHRGMEAIPSSSHRYGGLGGFIGRDKHYTWFDQDRLSAWGGDGKRRHDPKMCSTCAVKMPGNDMHWTVMTRPFSGPSYARAIPWLNGGVRSAFDDDMPEDFL